jgi:hypothetical protein
MNIFGLLIQKEVFVNDHLIIKCARYIIKIYSQKTKTVYYRKMFDLCFLKKVQCVFRRSSL